MNGISDQKAVVRMEDLGRLGVRLRAHARGYEGSQCTEKASWDAGPGDGSLSMRNADWKVTLAESVSPMGGLELNLRFQLVSGAVANAAVGVELEVSQWSREHYLFMPAAVYRGNRFRVLGNYRSPLPETGPNPAEIFISSQIPRLNIDPGESRIQLWTSDLSTPAVGFWSPLEKAGMFLLTDDRTGLGLSGITVEENADRSIARIRLMAPGVREQLQSSGRPSIDRGANWKVGDSVELRMVLHIFDSAGVQGLFDRFFDCRNEIRPEPQRREEIPFSSVWRTQEDKYNRQNWVEKYGYYSVGMRECSSQDWQTAWVGGLNTTYALLAEGDDVTRGRAERNLDFVFDGGVTQSGFLRGGFHEGKWSDSNRSYHRYNADGLYFLMKDLELLTVTRGAEAVASTWRRRTRELAEAFSRMWERYGQLGHYASVHRDELLIGGTCAASTAMGGLALASRYFNEPAFLNAAIEAGRYYHEKYVLHGLTNAGPGDILQAPDSESCFGLLESFITLHDVTGDAHWLHAAGDVARQCATWVTNYDFEFPAHSTFGKLGMLTNGTVWANVQNKHAAPGICTLSGLSLLKLFRAGGDARYLELIRDIAHAIPQYMSRADRPITDRRPGQPWPVMPPGWINERVNMSDWEVRGEPNHEIGVGEIFGGSTWSEPAMMLTHAELPGIYHQPDTRVLAVLDHVEAMADGGELRVKNPTKFPARVKLLIETSDQAKRPLGVLAMRDCATVALEAGEEKRVAVGR